MIGGQGPKSKTAEEFCKVYRLSGPKDIVLYNGKKYSVVGMQNKGAYVRLSNGKVCSLKKVKVLQHCNAWAEVN